MADMTIKRVEEMESIWDGRFVRARASLGARSFGMNIWNLPPHWDQNWEHDHVTPPAADNEEEVYTVLSGTATIRVAGKTHILEPGTFVRVGAAEKRKVEAGDQGAQILCIGGTPGRVYEPLPIVELGGPDSM
jgi:uncharacterized cupin superfamily protein